MQYKNILPIIVVGGLASCTTAQTNTDREEMTVAFQFIDKNDNNLLDLDEFSSVMKQAFREDMSEEFVKADSDNSKSISFGEAKEMGASRVEFQEADENQNGTINLDELISREVKSTFIDSDLNHDNVLDFSEFEQLE